jgi:hypothetical protein
MIRKKVASVDVNIGTEKPNIFLFWSKFGKKLTPGHMMCLESLKIHNPDFNIQLLDEETVCNFCTPMPNWLNQPDVVKRSDYIRTELLAKNGGIWIDSDILCMSSLMPIYKQAFSSPDGVCIHGDAFFAAKANSPFMQVALKTIKEIYFVAAANLLSKAFRNTRVTNPQWGFHASENKDKIYIFKEPKHDVKNMDDIYLVIFFFTHRDKYKKIWNAESPFELPTADSILNSTSDFAQFFKKALKK